MQDFGEALADIRDHFEGPFPIRVRQTRVFFAVFAQSLGSVLTRRELTHWGVPDYNREVDELLSQFQQLEQRPCTAAQCEQATDALREITARQQRRHDIECRLWMNAAQAGMFIGFLTLALLSISILMSLLTHQEAAILPLGVAFLLLPVISGVICRWLLWR